MHRFVVSATVEENVHRLCQSRAQAMDLSIAGGMRSKSDEKLLSVR